MSIPVRMPLPEQLAHTQSNLMAYCPYDYANGYNIAILRHLSAYKQMREELIALFSCVIAHATRPEDMEYVWFLRNICPHNFHELVPKLVEDCLNVLEERTAETTQKHDRDPALERIIIEERLPDTTLRYVKYLQHPSYKLLRILAIKHRLDADAIALRGLPKGTLQGHLLLADNMSAYGHIKQTLSRYEAIFGYMDTCCIANQIITRYPNRPSLKATLNRYFPQDIIS